MDAVKARYEAELANEYGNLASRSIAMIVRYRDGVVPTAATDPVIAAEFAELPAAVAAQIDRAEATQALELIWQRVRRLNRYVEERAPWQLAKDPADAAALDQVLATLHEGVRALSVLLYPYMPQSTSRLLRGARRDRHRLRRRGARAGAAPASPSSRCRRSSPRPPEPARPQ